MPRRKPLVFQTAFQQFTEDGLIGNGGAGRVFKCTDPEGVVWAVKVLDPRQATKEKLKRFKNEYNFYLRHPHTNIVGVTDSGVVDVDGTSVPFFVMPCFAQSLRDLMNKKQLAPDAVLKIYDQILSGVEAAHLWKVVHRDLKPENILSDPSGSRAAIADFGIAQFAVDELFTIVDTAPTARLANFQYAAPEQRAKGRPVDHRADIYALGLILNEMFTGEVPHGTGYRTIGSVAPQYVFLDDLVDLMRRQNPEERPASIQIIKADLIGRNQAFVELQALDKLKATVVPTKELSDPLIENPIQVVGANWANQVLTIKLSHPVNDNWIQVFKNMGSHVATVRQPPEAFVFRGVDARVDSEGSDAQRVINHFKGWLPQVNQLYAQKAKEAALAAEEAERKAHRDRIAAAELEQRVNRSLKI